MLKNILNLDGSKTLNRQQLLSINGGRKQCKNPLTGRCDDYGHHCAESACCIDL